MRDNKLSSWVDELNFTHGLAAIHYAAWKGNTGLMGLLIDAGGHADLVNKHGLGVMHIAAQADSPAALVKRSTNPAGLRETAAPRPERP